MPSSNVTLRHTSGGVPVVTEQIPGSVSSGYMVGVRTGSRDESPDIFGLSHLLEHVVFRATKSRTSFQLSKEIEGAGGYLNAFTGKEMTAFHAITIKDTADVAKEIVADIVSNPLIGKEDTEMEKKIVLQEISMVENDPERYIYDLTDEVIWKGHPLSQAEAGTREVVKGLKNTDLRKYYDERYRIPNLYVFACGAVDPDDTVRWAEENFDQMSGGRANPRSRPEVNGSGYTHFTRKEDHCYVSMGFRAFDPKDKDFQALQLLSGILGSGASSRLFQSVREEKALVYAIYDHVEPYTDASTFATYMSSTEENVLEAITTTAETYRRFKDEGIKEGELARARNLVKGVYTRHMESTEHRLYQIAVSTMVKGEPDILEKRLEALDAVTEEDVMRVAERYMDPKGLNVVMLGKDVDSMKDFSIDQLDF